MQKSSVKEQLWFPRACCWDPCAQLQKIDLEGMLLHGEMVWSTADVGRVPVFWANPQAMPIKGGETAGVHCCAVYSAGISMAVPPEENSPCGFFPTPSKTVAENQWKWMLLSSPHAQDVEKQDFSSSREKSCFFPGKKCVCTLGWIKKAILKRFWNRNSSLLQNEPQWKPDFVSLLRMTKYCQALKIADGPSCNSLICEITLTLILIF